MGPPGTVMGFQKKIKVTTVINTMYNVQLAVKPQQIYCTIRTMYTQLHVSAYFRPSSGCFV